MTSATLATPAAVAANGDRQPSRPSRVTAERTRASDARLVVALVAGAMLVFLPAAALVVGTVSATFARFALAIGTAWLVSTGLQVLAVRTMSRGPNAAPRFLQFAATSVIGVVSHIGLAPWMNQYSLPLGLDAGDGWEAVIGAWTTVLVGGFVIWVREAQARQAGAARRLFDVQQAQLRLRQQLVDSQLLAVQARVDPAFFFATLDRIEALYRTDTTRAEALFDELVVFLRAALPSLDHASSILARELDLAASCVRLYALATGHLHAMKIDIEAALKRMPYPAGVLLPLLRGLLDAAPAAFELAISAELGGADREDGGRLHVRIVAPSPGAGPMQATRAAVAGTLFSRYGSTATLAVGDCAGDGGRVQIHIAIPREP